MVQTAETETIPAANHHKKGMGKEKREMKKAERQPNKKPVPPLTECRPVVFVCVFYSASPVL